jgi:hypothetical protein
MHLISRLRQVLSEGRCSSPRRSLESYLSPVRLSAGTPWTNADMLGQ